jgi:hypothetical protein
MSTPLYYYIFMSLYVFISKHGTKKSLLIIQYQKLQYSVALHGLLLQMASIFF